MQLDLAIPERPEFARTEVVLHSRFEIAAGVRHEVQCRLTAGLIE